MSSSSAGPSGLSLEEQRALLREEQLRHVADLMESDEDELLVQALDEVEQWLAVPMDDENLQSLSIGKGYTTIVRPLLVKTHLLSLRKLLHK